jgi:Zn-dependent protease
MTQEKKSSKFVTWLLATLKIISKASATAIKIIKFGLAGASFLAYTYMFTWKFALIIIVQLFVHESGHIWAMKRCGLKTKGIFFIPFLGGAAIATGEIETRWDGVYIALMGPVFGGALAVVMWGIYVTMGNPMYAAGASWMALINVINLLPIHPLDGGRVMKDVTFSIGSITGLVFMGITLVLGLIFMVVIHWWLFVILIPLCILETMLEWARFRKEKLKLQMVLENNQKTRTMIAPDGKMVGENLLVNPQGTVVMGTKMSALNDILDQQDKEAMELMKVLDGPVRMDKNRTIVAVLSYIILILSLYLVMKMTREVPGAHLAFQMLQ